MVRKKRAGGVVRVGLAICDQAVFAGSSFAVTLLLARWMTQSEFGAFTVAYVIFVLIQNVIEGVLYEPFAVFGAGRFWHQFNAYVGRALIAQAFIGLASACMMGIVAAVMLMLREQLLANAFWGVSIASPFLLARILMRQPFYVVSCIHWSVMAGMVNLVSSLIVISAFNHLGRLAPFSAFLALGIGSCTSVIFAYFAIPRPVWHTADGALSPRVLIANHLAYGKWVMGERILFWLQTNIFFLVLPLVAGLHASAAYRAITTLAMPANMTMMAIGSVLLPALVRAQAGQVTPQWVRLAFPAAVLIMVVYGGLLLSIGHDIGNFLFAGQYDTDLTTSLFAVVASGLVLYGVIVVLEAQLRSALRVRQILIARLAAAGMLLIVGISITNELELVGAAIALDLTYLATFLTHLAMNQRRRR